MKLCIESAIVNFFLNGAIGWLITLSHSTLPFWGEVSFGGDTLATAIALPLIIGLIFSPLMRHELAVGKVPPLSPDQLLASSWPARSAFVRGLWIGVVAMIVVALPVLGVLHGLGVESMSRQGFVLYKACFAGVLAAGVAPILGWWALARATTGQSSSTTGSEAVRRSK